MKIKQRPEDFVVREGYRFDDDPDGQVWVYRLDKQKVSTLQAVERISKEFAVRRRNLSVCGLKDKQGRTEQLLGVLGGSLGETEVVQTGDLRLQLIGRTAQPLSSENITANRFEVTVRDLSLAESARVPESVAEVQRTGVVNYFDSQRFGFLKHGQGFIAKQLVRGDWEGALKSFLGTPSQLDHSDDAKVKAFWRDHWGEWQLRAPQDAGARYAPLLRRLREDPRDFKGAFLHIDRRLRMMVLFELQSYVWNEGVKRYLGGLMPASELVGLRYQAGALLFPRSLPRELRDELWPKTFPLLAPDSKFDDEQVRAAAVSALSTQGLKLEDLKVPETPQLFFKHEERPLFVVPGKLHMSGPRPDELNRGRQKINLSFTLPPGAYASLVVRRVLWFAVDGARDPSQEFVSERAGHKADARPSSASSTPAAGKVAWGQPALGARGEKGAPVSPAATDGAEPGERAEPAPAAPQQKMGFRTRQKMRKQEKANSRAVSNAPKPPAVPAAKRIPPGHKPLPKVRKAFAPAPKSFDGKRADGSRPPFEGGREGAGQAPAAPRRKVTPGAFGKEPGPSFSKAPRRVSKPSRTGRR